MNVAQDAFVCTAGPGAQLHTCAADSVAPRPPVFAGVFSAWLGLGEPKLIGGWMSQ